MPTTESPHQSPNLIFPFDRWSCNLLFRQVVPSIFVKNFRSKRVKFAQKSCVHTQRSVERSGWKTKLEDILQHGFRHILGEFSFLFLINKFIRLIHEFGKWVPNNQPMFLEQNVRTFSLASFNKSFPWMLDFKCP